MDRAAVSGGGVAEGVEGGDRDVVGDTRDVRARETGDDESRGPGGIDDDARLSPGDRSGHCVGGGHRLRAGRLEGHAEGADAGRQGPVGRQDRRAIGTGEVDRAGVAGRGVAEGVEGGDGDVVGDARHVRSREVRDREVRGRSRVHVQCRRAVSAAVGTGHGMVAGRTRGAGCGRARRARVDGEGRVARDIAYAVVGRVVPDGGVGLAATGSDRGGGGANDQMVDFGIQPGDAPVRRAQIAGGGRIRPVADSDAGAALSVVDLDVEPDVRVDAAAAEEADGRLDVIAVADDLGSAGQASSLIGLGVAAAERDLVLEVDADLRVVNAVSAALGVHVVDVDLDGVLLPWVGVGVVENRVDYVHEDVEDVAPVQELGRPDRGVGAGDLLEGLDRGVGQTPDAGILDAVDRGSVGRGSDVDERQRLDERHGAHGSSVVPTRDGGAVRVGDVELDLVLRLRTTEGEMGHGQPAAGDLGCYRSGVDLASRDGVGLVAHLERQAVRSVNRGVLDGHVDAQVVGHPARLEADLVAGAEHDQRQLLPFERGRRAAVQRDVGLEDVRRAEARLECGRVGGAAIGRLGRQAVTEDERVLGRVPADGVVEAPYRNGEEVRGAGSEDPERVAIEVTLIDQRGVVHRTGDADVQLADDLLDRQILEGRKGVIETLDLRGQGLVELVPDEIHGHVVAEQESDQVVQALALARRVGVVVVDAQLDGARDADRGVGVVECLVRPVERVLDVLLAEDLVVPALTQTVRVRGPVGDDLVHDVERHDRVGGAAEQTVLVADGLGDVVDVILEPRSEERLVIVTRRQGRHSVGRQEEPIRSLAVPDHRVSVAPKVVRGREVEGRLRLRTHSEVLASVIPALDLHRVL